MKKYLIIPFLLFFTCGGSQDSIDEVEPNSNNIDTTTTVQDTTTTTTNTIVEDSTTTTVQDTTTRTIVKNKCDNCEYVSIEELNTNINSVPQFAWNDYQRISNENIDQLKDQYLKLFQKFHFQILYFHHIFFDNHSMQTVAHY